MKKMLYASIFSVLISACAAKTTLVDYPVVINGEKGVYTKDSNGNCYLKIPEPEGYKVQAYNEGCDETADSISSSFQEYTLFHHDREDLNVNSRQYIDSLFQEAKEYLDQKNKKCDYNDLPF